MIDSDGYRANVGIVLINDLGQAFWGRRIGMSAWQFPQGGIQQNETPRAAMFRELAEEVGLRSQHVEVIGCTRGWLRYSTIGVGSITGIPCVVWSLSSAVFTTRR